MFQASQEEPWARPNVWPEGLPGFREAIMAFHTAATHACERLMQAIAVSLDLPGAISHRSTTAATRPRACCTIRRWPSPRRPGRSARARTPTSGASNLLFPGAEGGLEIQARGRHLAAPPRPARGRGW